VRIGAGRARCAPVPATSPLSSPLHSGRSPVEFKPGARESARLARGLAPAPGESDRLPSRGRLHPPPPHHPDTALLLPTVPCRKYIAKFGDKLKPGRRIDPVLQSSVGAVVTS